MVLSCHEDVCSVRVQKCDENRESEMLIMYLYD
jgi:hypothetical protein